jgi:hypothetical protein
MVTIPLTGRFLNSFARTFPEINMNENKPIKSGRQIPNRSFFNKLTPYPQHEPGVTVVATFSKIYYSQAD